MFKIKLSLFLFIAILHSVYCQSDGGTTTIETVVETTTSDVVDTTTTDAIEETTTSDVVDTTTTDASEETTTSDSNVETTTEIILDTTTIETIIDTTTIEPDVETTTIEVTTTTPILFLRDENDKISWSPKSTQSVIIEAAKGYKISVNVTDCNIDGKNGEYATIATALDEDTNALMFTYGVTTKPAYLYNNNILYGQFVGSDASNFTVEFSLVGEELIETTTEVPTTTISLPSPDSNVESTLLVYLSGRSAGEYSDPNNTEILDALISSITNMATMYCGNENFPLNGSITTSNVIINYLVPCSLGWPSSGTCVQLNFSVPVNLIEDSSSLWTGYQMTTAHLRIMWSRYANQYLPDGITIYTPPGDGSFKWGVAILIAVTVVFALILLIVRHCGMKVSKLMRRRKLSDTASIIPASERNSQISLPPHYLQDTPALFENAYPMYNPDKNPEYSEPTYVKSFDYSNYQDLSAVLDPHDDEEGEVEESGA